MPFDFGKQGDTAASAQEALLAKNPQFAALAANPDFAAAIQDELAHLVGQDSGYFKELPPKVQRRVKVLRLIQKEHLELQKAFEDEMQAMREKYESKFAPLLERRAKITKGEEDDFSEAELKSADVLWEEMATMADSDDDSSEVPDLVEIAGGKSAEAADAAADGADAGEKFAEADLSGMSVGDLKSLAKERGVSTEKFLEKADFVSALTGLPKTAPAQAERGDDDAAAGDDDVKGVPEFWLTVFRNHEEIEDLISERDAKLLKHLIDVRYELGAVPDHQDSFKLIFTFEPNDYFENTELTKVYDIAPEGVLAEPNFQGMDGCEIKWKGLKNNVTVGVEKKAVQQGGGRGRRGRRGGRGGRGAGGATKMVEEVIPVESFFRFFDPLNEYKNAGDLEMDLEPEVLQDIVMNDYQLGEEIREKIIPYAVMWYLGELDAAILGDEGSDGESISSGEFEASMGTKMLGGADLDSEDDSSDEEFVPPAEGQQECKQQ